MLQTELGEIEAKHPEDVLLIGGDLNARVGEPDDLPEEIYEGTRLRSPAKPHN